MYNLKDYYVELIDKNVGKELIVENHYSKKWSSCRYCLGLYCESELIGVAVYGFPVGRLVGQSISPLIVNSDVLELTRLWLIDEAPKNSESRFLGLTFKWLKKHTDIKVLISYSDPMFGHVGTIYQATNWLYQGNNTMLVKGYSHIVFGEELHPRSCFAKYGTIKEKELKLIDPDYKRVELKKKHRYVFILDSKNKNKIINTLKHPILSYVKDNQNCEWVSKKKEVKL